MKRPGSAVLAVLVLMAVLTGCATGLGTALGTDRIAASHGMQRRIVLGTRFHHLAYIKGDLRAAPEVHVYLEGDGIPWRTRHQIAADPTPRNPLALRLMAQDPAASVYVGRPCYFGLALADGCGPWLWTHGRYGPEVVESLVAAVEALVPSDGRRRIQLIGYSGGGALAALIAPRLAGVKGLVTLSANLDIDAWADRHSYSRLSGSLNPADQPPIDRAIAQLHLLGGRDTEVPPATTERFFARHPGAHARLYSDYDHRCCWLAIWPSALDALGL